MTCKPPHMFWDCWTNYQIHIWLQQSQTHLVGRYWELLACIYLHVLLDIVIVAQQLEVTESNK